MATQITRISENAIQIRPKFFYKDIGAVSLRVQKEKFNEKDDEMGTVSMFQHYSGDQNNENAFTLQLRGFSSYSDTSKPKGFIASISLTESDITALYNFAKEHREKMEAHGFGSLKKAPKIIDLRDGQSN